MAPNLSSRIFFSFVGLTFQFDCRDSVTEFLILKNFGNKDSPSDLSGPVYRLQKTDEGFLIQDSHGTLEEAATDGDFVYAVEKKLTIEAQLRRQDLYFVHAGVLASHAGAFVLSGESGAGKSTLTWALLHNGFDYLSDELAPIELEGLRVYPYPHAICLKKEPPIPYILPKGVLRTSRTFHVPVESLPSRACREEQPLRFLFFIRYDPAESEPRILPISPMEGAARLYSNTLNSLAHAGLGLEKAISIAKNYECFTVTSPSAERTCRALQEIVPL
jgi:hypothetical protein